MPDTESDSNKENIFENFEGRDSKKNTQKKVKHT